MSQFTKQRKRRRKQQQLDRESQAVRGKKVQESFDEIIDHAKKREPVVPLEFGKRTQSG